MVNKTVYLDNAATTPLSPGAFDAMRPWLEEQYGNPSSLYRMGREARKAVERAREQVAGAIHAEPDEIFFTGSGTEANNWVISGVKGGEFVLTTLIEHHAILNSLKAFDPACSLYYRIGKDGVCIPFTNAEADFIRFRNYPALCTAMLLNNELGTVQPIRKLFDGFRGSGMLHHTDAVQAVGHMPIDVKELGVDLLSMSAHKFNGPKGVGALYVKRGTPLPPFIHGGAQESGKRAGTENVAGIVGMGQAIAEAVEHMEERNEHVLRMKRLFVDMCEEEQIDMRQNVPFNESGILSVCFPGVDAESLLLTLDNFGVCASAGSACNSSSIEASHVLRAIGLNEAQARSTIRFSFGHQNTEADIEHAVSALKNSLQLLEVKPA